MEVWFLSKLGVNPFAGAECLGCGPHRVHQIIPLPQGWPAPIVVSATCTSGAERSWNLEADASGADSGGRRATR